jgi:16S rRNA G966 N2-methylase RsmD
MDISQSRYYFQLEIKLSQTQENLYFKMNDLQISDIVLLDPPYPLITI